MITALFYSDCLWYSLSPSLAWADLGLVKECLLEEINCNKTQQIDSTEPNSTNVSSSITSKQFKLLQSSKKDFNSIIPQFNPSTQQKPLPRLTLNLRIRNKQSKSNLRSGPLQRFATDPIDRLSRACRTYKSPQMMRN